MATFCLPVVMTVSLWLCKQGICYCAKHQSMLYVHPDLKFVRLGRTILMVPDLGHPVLSKALHYCFAFVKSTELSVIAVAC
jgi:hypothetical protein